MSATRKGGLKYRDKKLQEDPDFYKKLTAKARAARRTTIPVNAFKAGDPRTTEMARKAGQKSGEVRRAKRLKIQNELRKSTKNDANNKG